MKVINLIIKSKHFVNQEIQSICGGKSIETFWISGFQKGIGGLGFTDPESSNHDEKYMVSIAFFKTGLGIYCRNMYSNYLVLIPENELLSFKLIKEKDFISPKAISLFSIMNKMGFSYHTSSKYLMPKEIILENPAELIIRTPEKFFKLEIDKITPDKLINVFKKSKFVHLLEVQIELPKLLNQ